MKARPRRNEVAEQMEHLVEELRVLAGLAGTALSKFGKYATKQELKELEKRIMATAKKLTDDLAAASIQLQETLDQQKKTVEEIVVVQSEVTTLKTTVDTLNIKIKDLEDLIAAGGDAITPELIAAVATVVAQGKAVKDQSQVVDDVIPDVLPLN